MLGGAVAGHLGGVAGARLRVVEANRRGSDCPEHVSVAGNWEPQDLSDMGKCHTIETAHLCRAMSAPNTNL